MIKSLKNRPQGPTPIEIDLSGPKGNAHYLLSLAENLAKQLVISGRLVKKKIAKHITTTV